MIMKGFVVYPTYKTINDRSFVFLYGRLENGESFVTINSFKPYFFIKEIDLERAKKIASFEFERCELSNFDKERVIKIILDVPADVPDLRKQFSEEEIESYEADIKFPYRFMMDKGIKGCLEIEGDYEEEENVDRVYKEPELRGCEPFDIKLKILSIDIEVGSSGEIYCISMICDDKRISLANKKVKGSVFCEDEEELIEKFRDYILEIDPDIITGWNVIDFDFEFLREKFIDYKIDFRLGRDNSKSKIKIESDFFVDSKMEVSGRVVLDGLNLIRGSFVKLDNYKLETASQKFLGSGKLLDLGKEDIDDIWEKDPERLVEYNLKDSELVLDILDKSKIIDLTIQRSFLTGMPLDRVGASIASLDSLYIREAHKRGLVVPNAHFLEKERKVTGGYVKESEPGIYDFMLVLDFKSLYPSVIRTFNIDPSSFLGLEYEGDCIKVVNGACYKREEGILPEILAGLWAARDKFRKDGNELGRQAVKILMNSFWGALASPASRFFNMNMANSITKTCQFLIKKTADLVEERGYHVIYQDTDSCFVLSKCKDLEEAEELGKTLEKEINEFYKKWVRAEYDRENILQIEYEKCFVKFIMPKTRGKETGAKKRYAGLLIKKGEEKIEVTGMEAIRGDWTILAKKFQMELLDRVFHNKEIDSFIKKFILDLKKGKFDADLVYRKHIRKSLEEYTATTPPHVKAARKLESFYGDVVEYVMTEDGPEVIQQIKHKIDYDHYLDKQIKPIAESILVFFNRKFEDLVKGSSQKGLFEF